MKIVPPLLSALLLACAHGAHANELVSSFQDYVVFTNMGYSSGETVISNFPLRVDISAARPHGFDYDNAGDRASTLRFNYREEYLDHGTNAVIDQTAHFAITNWNVDGVSTLYVKVPRFSNNPGAKLTMYWNPADYAEIPENLSLTVPPAVRHPDKPDEWNQAIEDQATNENYLACGPAMRRVLKGATYVDMYQNYWLTEPTISKKSWKQGEEQATVTTGLASQDNETTVEYYDRSDNSSVGLEMPVVPGAYRALVTVAEGNGYAELTHSLDFTIESGASVDGMATTNDFAYCVGFALVVEEGLDSSLSTSVDSLSFLTGKPFLVKLAENSPSGFHYADLTFGQTEEAFYSDARFYSETGEALNYEIQEWNPGGTSVIWVKVRRYSESTRVYLCWGQGAYTKLPANDPSAVWSPGTSEEEKAELREYYEQSGIVDYGTVREDVTKRLQNRWLEEPSMAVTCWRTGENPPTVFTGTSYGGNGKVAYFDRTTGEKLAMMPTAEVGEYRAVFTVDETEKWSSLEKIVEFRVIAEVATHDLGNANARAALANNDGSVAGGEIYSQGYDDNEAGWGTPYWTHHEKDSTEDVSDFDSTKLFAGYNLFAGTCHEYMSGDTKLWGLVNVRFGNLFNNGKYHPGEQGDEGLNPDQNYLPWNPQSERMLGYEGLTVGAYHRYAGTFVMQNVRNELTMDYAQICSPLYEDGIGTVYFDIVNAFTNNVRDADGNANYAIVLEVATNVVDAAGTPPYDAPWPKGIWSSTEDGTTVYDAYRYGDWQAVSMTPIRFRADTGAESDCEILPGTTELELDVTDGGTSKNFYRVYADVNFNCPARFRIRRTRIDEGASLNPDADAFIIVDNLICSKGRDTIRLVPYGRFDEDRHGKQYIGREAAFVPAFPGPKDAVTARVRALDSQGREVEPSRLNAVTMHYRWHYLEQCDTDWRYVDFSTATLHAREPLVLPGLPGDIEFWFDGVQNCDSYYTYANYSGTRLGVPGYSEYVALLTNGWNGAGSDFNLRIREGSSDIEDGVLIVREPNRPDREIQMELVDSHQWRGYYLTTNAIADGVLVRFELRNEQTSGATEWNWSTNHLYSAENDGEITKLPHCGKLADGSTNSWTRVPVDAATGYLMFQVDESTRGLTAVRADYQNFNHWTDALGSYFVGSSSDDSTLPKSGTSPMTQDFTAYYNHLTNDVSVATNSLWDLNFETRTLASNAYYKTFAASTETMNGWKLGKGRYVYGNYRMPDSGTAHQMCGASEGFVELSDQTINLWPRGVEKVTFNARLAQSVEFDDFTYFDEGRQLKNYAFKAHVAFDHNSNQSFTGDASLSLVAYYRRGTGCYEARWEQTEGEVDTKGTVTGPKKSKGQVLSLYRWNRSGSRYVQTLLATFKNDGKDLALTMPDTDAKLGISSALFLPVSLAAYSYNDAGDVMLVVGLHSGGTQAGVDGPDKWQYAAYLDNSAQKLTSGAYGVLSANCPGLFVRPRVAKLGDDKPTWGSFKLPEAGKKNSSGNSTTTYPDLSFTSCRSDIDDGLWVSVPGRSESFSINDTAYGYQAADVCQTVDLWASSASEAESFSELLATFTLSNYWGTINKTDEFGADIPLVWRARDAKLRLRTGGELDDAASPGVIVDNVRVHQWRGKNEIYLYKSGDSADNKNDCEVVDNAKPGDFVYTGGWINSFGGDSTAIEFSARRTIPGRPAGVRTPLMDGVSGKRGQGIGNLCFSYRNAQTNVALLVQVATNVFRGQLETVTCDVSDDYWRTVCRLTYEELGDSGTTNIAFGIRNTLGGRGAVARVILDPALVEAVSNVTDQTAFGSISISYASCQDEPPIDKGCWWGWNLRTLGDHGDSEKRMYLPDASMMPDPGFSLALNNSTEDEIVEAKADEYKRHMPFLQSPSFTSNVIGQLTFRARKYGYSDRDQAAEVALYGITASELARSGEWTLLSRFTVSNTVFTGYSYRADLDAGYCAFRLGVTGVKGVNSSERGPSPLYGTDPVRVLLDEVVVSESVTPELAFRNVGAFRTDMSGTAEVPGVPCKSEQPLAGEGWGVQCELFALMLAEEIDMTKPPRVKLYWYEGDDNWGFENWKSLPDAKSAWLARASGTDSLIYRSSYDTAPEAVIPQSEKVSGGIAPVVQYMLEAYYTVVDPKTGAKTETSKLLDVSAGQWKVPDWYAPLDYNNDAKYGKGENWSCFCILDDIAPGWVWINEVNILNFNHSTWDNDDVNCQFVEIAAPRDFDLSEWKIQFLESHEEYQRVYTNTVAVFGRNGLAGTKDLNAVSNYVFHVVANPDRFAGDRSVLERTGALDGIWYFENPTSVFARDGTVDWGESFAIRLLRQNGIVEHEIVVVGTNVYNSASMAQYSPTGVVAYLNRVSPPDRYFHPGQDCTDGDHSVGVVNSQGEGAVCWNNTMRRTPGEINEDQQINPDYPVPQGEMMTVYLELDQSGGNVWQSLDGGLSFTNDTRRLYLKNGSIVGTNVLYKVEPWYEMDYACQVTQDSITYFDVSNTFDRVNRTVEVNVGRFCSNRVTVVARATPDHQLRELGCDEKNLYTPAVIDWLQKGCTLDGHPFANNDGILRRAEFWGLVSGSTDPPTYLGLTEMYWLDIDPTVGDMVLQAGMCKPPEETLARVYDDYGAPSYVTNLRMSVFMMITNKTTDTLSPYYGAAWSPYVLRSVEPGKCSTNYTTGAGMSWTSETFKISGILPNGHTSEKIRDNWVDLRWFVFKPDSFYQPSDEPEHPRFTTDIEIRDPVNSTESPGYGAGWYDWVHDPEHPERANVRPFFRWGLDTRLRPFEVEVLKTNNYLNATEP